MAKKRNKNNKKTKTGRFLKIYAVSCIIGLVAGGLTLLGINSVSLKVAEMNKNIIKIGSYESVGKGNGEKTTASDVEADKIAEKAEKVTEESVKVGDNGEKVQKEVVGGEKEVKVEESGDKSTRETQKMTEKTDLVDENGAEVEKVEQGSEAVTVNTSLQETENIIILTMPCEGEIIKEFSMDKPLKSKTMGDFRVHSGVDIKSTLGDSVKAAADGVIEKVENDAFLGVTVLISHSENLKTQYSNLAGGDMVESGMKVKKGQCIGCVGDTAKTEMLDEAHLHFAVIEDGKYVNPSLYMGE